jgi:hypothetical protein
MSNSNEQIYTEILPILRIYYPNADIIILLITKYNLEQ